MDRIDRPENRRGRTSGALRGAREKWAPLFVLLAVAVGFFNAGMAWMTHMHHDGLRHVPPGEMAAYDVNYERLADLVVVPMSALSVLCAVSLLLFRDRRVPWWMVGAGVALQVSVWTVRMTVWGPLADETRAAGWTVGPGGVLEPSYADYMNTNWIRIALLTGYAVLTLAMLGTILVRWLRAEPKPSHEMSAPGSVATVTS